MDCLQTEQVGEFMLHPRGKGLPQILARPLEITSRWILDRVGPATRIRSSYFRHRSLLDDQNLICTYILQQLHNSARPLNLHRSQLGISTDATVNPWIARRL